MMVAVGCSLDVIFVLCGQRRWSCPSDLLDILPLTKPVHARLPVAANTICYSARRFDPDRPANPLISPDSRGQFSAPNNSRTPITSAEVIVSTGLPARRGNAYCRNDAFH